MLLKLQTFAGPGIHIIECMYFCTLLLYPIKLAEWISKKLAIVLNRQANAALMLSGGLKDSRIFCTGELCKIEGQYLLHHSDDGIQVRPLLWGFVCTLSFDPEVKHLRFLGNNGKECG